MRVLFLQNNALDESLALVDLAAYLEQKGHTCSLLLEREESDLVSAARRERPQLIVIACSVLNHTWARAVAARLQTTVAAPIVAGGTGPTLVPSLLSYSAIDYLVRGEAETPIEALLECLETGSMQEPVPGLYTKTPSGWDGISATPGIELQQLPITSKDLYYDRYPFMRAFPFKRFLTGRGCHHRCTYCYIPALNKVQPRGPGRRWTRRKDPEQAVEEVYREQQAGPLSHVHFSDDLFTSDKEWLAAFAPLYRKRVGIPFTCNTSAELIDDEVADALAEAGCYAIGYAVETASTRLRLKVLRKGVTTDHLLSAAKSLRKNGVKIATFNMLALPGETPEEALQTALLNAEMRTDFVRLNYAFPMPGTGMYEYAIENGFLAPNWGERFGDPDWSYTPGPQFITPYRQEFQNLFVLFRLVAKDQRVLPWVQRSLQRNTPKWAHRLLTLQGAWNEKQSFRIPLVAGLRFFGHVGRPELRANNFPALI